RESDAALFWWAATVVWYWRYIADDGEVEPNRLQRTDGRFPARTRPFHPHLHFLQTVPHRLARSILSHHLGGVGRAFSGAFEANFSSARPADDLTGQVGDRDDRVVES